MHTVPTPHLLFLCLVKEKEDAPLTVEKKKKSLGCVSIACPNDSAYCSQKCIVLADFTCFSFRCRCCSVHPSQLRTAGSWLKRRNSEMSKRLLCKHMRMIWSLFRHSSEFFRKKENDQAFQLDRSWSGRRGSSLAPGIPRMAPPFAGTLPHLRSF